MARPERLELIFQPAAKVDFHPRYITAALASGLRRSKITLNANILGSESLRIGMQIEQICLEGAFHPLDKAAQPQQYISAART